VPTTRVIRAAKSRALRAKWDVRGQEARGEIEWANGGCVAQEVQAYVTVRTYGTWPNYPANFFWSVVAVGMLTGGTILVKEDHVGYGVLMGTPGAIIAIATTSAMATGPESIQTHTSEGEDIKKSERGPCGDVDDLAGTVVRFDIPGAGEFRGRIDDVGSVRIPLPAEIPVPRPDDTSFPVRVEKPSPKARRFLPVGSPAGTVHLGDFAWTKDGSPTLRDGIQRDF
jgi:hypothetical protein